MRTRRAGRGGERGTTLTELMFTLAMFGLLLGTVVKFVYNGRMGITRQENASEMLKRSTLIASNLRAGLQTSNLLLCKYPANTPDFTDLRSMFCPGSNGPPARVTFSQEPTVLEVAKPDLSGPGSVSSSAWGNELIYVAKLNPITFTVKYGVASTSPMEVVSVPRVQLVAYYLSRDRKTRMPNNSQGALRLTEWRSMPLVSYETLSSFSNTPYPRALSSCVALGNMGYLVAFDASHAADINNSFYWISGTTTVLMNPLTELGCLATSTWAYVDDYSYMTNYEVPAVSAYNQWQRINRQGYGGSSGSPSTYCIAPNTLSATASGSSNRVNGLMAPGAGINGLSVPAYAMTDYGGTITAQAGFPGGFEITVVGKPHARIAFIRTVMMSNAGAYPKYGNLVFPALERHTSLAIDNAY